MGQWFEKHWKWCGTIKLMLSSNLLSLQNWAKTIDGKRPIGTILLLLLLEPVDRLVCLLLTEPY